MVAPWRFDGIFEPKNGQTTGKVPELFPVALDPAVNKFGRVGDDGAWYTYGIVIGESSEADQSLDKSTYYLRPDIYDSSITVVSAEGCIDSLVSSNCSSQRGQTFKDLSSNVSNNADDYSTWDYENTHGFQRNLHNSSQIGGGPKYESVTISDNQASRWRLTNQRIRVISSLDPFVGTIGLSISSLRSIVRNTSSSRVPSFLEAMKDSMGLPSLSWSYCESPTSTEGIYACLGR
jgi:hypothetical protein